MSRRSSKCYVTSRNRRCHPSSKEGKKRQPYDNHLDRQLSGTVADGLLLDSELLEKGQQQVGRSLLT